MEKRYQVFVSSTYEDLHEERQEVMHALLELDCMPAGMELFPAADDDQWTLIKNVITECDYYIVIIGGRYGSLNNEGISYTEMEYRYALEISKPIIAFLHKDPDALPAKRTEQNIESKEKLKEFRNLCENKMCKYWENPSNLGSVVSRSLIRLIKSNPSIGWVRADQISDQEATKEILKLRHRIEELEYELFELKNKPPEGIKNLSQGEDEFKIHYSFQASQHLLDFESKYFEEEFIASWNSIFAYISPYLINESKDFYLKGALNNFCKEANHEYLNSKEKEELIGYKFTDFRIRDDDFQTIKVQLRALGLIIKSVKQRSIKDTETYWTLTPYGDTLMTQLRAIRKIHKNKG